MFENGKIIFSLIPKSDFYKLAYRQAIHLKCLHLQKQKGPTCEYGMLVAASRASGCPPPPPPYWCCSGSSRDINLPPPEHKQNFYGPFPQSAL